MTCVSCVKMDYGVEEGGIPREFIEYDFAEDALEFETQLAEAREVKFTQALAQPLAIGSHVVITGTPSDDLPWFAVNIGLGDAESGRGDVAVHFNVRMPQCYVVRNTRRHGKWGVEETTAFRSFPFKTGRPFTLEVLVEEKESLWAVDGAPYCRYSHRVPAPAAAAWLQAAGLRDASITVARTDCFPQLAPPPLQVPCRPHLGAPPLQDEPSWEPNAVATFKDGVPEGHQVVIHGRLRPLLHSFALELTDVAREWPPPNVHVHVNVRAHDDAQQSRQLVVLNAWLGAWGAERRQRTARLVPGDCTTFRIVRGAGEWAVYADDVLIGELEYRASPQGVRALRLKGDLYPRSVYVCPAAGTPVDPQ